MPTIRHHHGFVLVTAMIFLLVLTLVAVVAVKSSGLELRMSANNVMHTEAFQASEGPRQTIGRLIERLGFYAESGWPAAIGGATPDSQFAYTIPDRLTILDADGEDDGAPLNWFIDIAESEFSYAPFVTALDADPKARARYDLDNLDPDDENSPAIRALVDVKRARTAPKRGCDLSSGGYEGVSSRNCADYIFLITSRGYDQNSTLPDLADADAEQPQANYETSSMYRYVPR